MAVIIGKALIVRSKERIPAGVTLLVRKTVAQPDNPKKIALHYVPYCKL